ncbi:hypothetical protein J7E73_13825 [Paenibacillus albidus]|uniref:hypothetical protein n=1 Tax=Paenibacillus albidus TaxID=2041023 RepID=UPI001BE5C376|nr:hypothetical protein [Paenibacillus albidus]MBT2290201.1 hypothetical protein [Paenibacillus albidus]
MIAIKKLLFGILLVLGIVGILSGCGSDEKEVLKNRISISDEQRKELDLLIEKGDYENLALETYSDRNNSIELNAMYYFAKSLDAFYNDGNMMQSYFDEIPEEYKDHFSKLLKEKTHAYFEKSIEDEKVKYKDLPPAIGENREQLKTSSWGLPNDINKTVTENNVSEQWVYGDGKYVYLENGIVTTIQE